MTSRPSDRSAPTLAAWFTMAISLAVLIGWCLGLDALKSVATGLVAMNPATALAFVLLACSLLCRRREPGSQKSKLCARIAAAVVVAAASLVLGDYIFGCNVGVDQQLFAGELDGNRMAPNTAVNLILLGSALLFFDVRTKRRFWPSQVLLLLVTASSLFSLVGYGYGAHALYGLTSYIPMALNTAVLFFAMSLGALSARPDRGAFAVLLAHGAGGVVARRMLPVVVGIPCLLGWLRLAGQAARLFDTEFGTALMVALNVCLSLALVIWIASALNRADNDRQQAQAQLRAAYDDLELRVQQRTAQLASANEALADANSELGQKNQENEMFVYSVSHDLRSPLVNLQGFSKELESLCQDLRAILNEDGVPSPVQQRGLQIVDGDIQHAIRFIRSGVMRLSTIIDALLRLSRAGRVDYQYQRLDMQSLVSRIVESVSNTAYDRGAEIVIQDLPPASGDAAAIEQVFANLIQNALNYLDSARPGQIEIGCADSGDESDGGLIAYYVQDNGLGIAEAYISKVFQVFKRFHGDVAKGEGIGLAIVRRVVERHGGKAWVESKQGAGSRFFVTLPAVPPPNKPAGDKPASERQEYQNLERSSLR